MKNSSEIDIQKETSMLLQKVMIGEHYKKLAKAKENNKKVVYTFVPGNLNELIYAFDMLPVHPEINALQSGMRKKSGEYITEAEKHGHSEDVCTYVKCDIGMMKKGNIGPTGEKIPDPDLLLLSYTGCFTFLKWFELLKEQYDCPVVMLHVPYQGDGVITKEMITYVDGDLLQAKVECLVNTVNCVGISGKGIALRFKQVYPDNYKLYREKSKN